MAISAAIEIPTTFPIESPKKIPVKTAFESPAIVGMTTATAVKANSGRITKFVAGCTFEITPWARAAGIRTPNNTPAIVGWTPDW